MTKRFLLFACCFIFFTFGKIYAADYYWIGGSGKWSEISHWATSSGGTVTYAQTPTANDNVFFDANSFRSTNQTITFDDDNVFCRSITINNVVNNPRFTSSEDSRLNVFGSVTIADNCIWDFRGGIIFQSTENEMTINFGTKKAAQNVTFAGSGSWALQNPLLVDATLSITAGTINFNNHRVECNYLLSLGSGRRTINFNESAWIIKGKTNILNEFWDDDPRNTWSIKMNVQNLTTTSNNAKFELTTSRSDIYITGPGPIELPGILYSSANGRSAVKALQNQASITLKGDLEAHHTVFFNTPLNFRILIAKPGVIIGFLSGGNYKINSITGDGSCAKYITLLSFPNNNLATIESTSASNVSFYQINNIRFTGTGTANNSLKLGSTQGWTFNEKTSQNFYWVGRNGNWSDGSKWSLSSGGPGAGCVPSAADNVFFDNNSFNGGNQFINVNEENVYCKDMKWLNIPSGTGIDGDLDKRIQIYGSLEFSSPVQHNYDGEYLFLGSGNNTITSRGKVFTRDVYFINDQGTWTFTDDFENERRVIFNSGKLIFNNVKATFNRFISTDKAKREMELRNSLLIFNLYHNWFPNINLQAENLTIIPGGSEIRYISSYGNFSVEGNNSVNLNKLTFNTSRSGIYNWANISNPNAIIK